MSCSLKDERSKKLIMSPNKKPILLDLSDLYRPELNKNGFRLYDSYKAQNGDPIMKRVFDTYYSMHANQTLEFVKRSKDKWLKFNHAKLTVGQALLKLNSIVDESDPDTSLPNIVHAYQSAERARAAHPGEDWLHLTGLLHDLGKVMAFWDEPQWAVVGDTYPLGCRPAPSVVFRNSGAFEANPDFQNGLFDDELGIYERNCGLDNLTMTWGHDEYLYHVLKNHPRCSLPDESLYIVRFHSFYPWHAAGHYWQFANDRDKRMFHWVKEFNKFDLYSKSDEQPVVKKVAEYYDSLIQKYLPGLIDF